MKLSIALAHLMEMDCEPETTLLATCIRDAVGSPLSFWEIRSARSQNVRSRLLAIYIVSGFIAADCDDRTDRDKIAILILIALGRNF
jgi:hypothetical protein